MNIYVLTSQIPRAEETAQIVGQEIGNNDIKKKKYLSYIKHPEAFQQEWVKWSSLKEKTENEIVKTFLNGEREVKPNILAKPYLRKLETIFERSIRKNIQVSVISFRHGDKDSKGNLSDKGKKQAKSLGEKLKNDLEKNNKDKDIILAATHNVINESIVKCLIHDDFPNEWMDPLDFTETVKYTFYPNNQYSEPRLEIEWRGIKREIPYEKFKELVKYLTK